VIKIVVGDQDHSTYIDQLISAIEQEKDILLSGVTTQYHDVYQLIAQKQPDIVILDFMDPVEHGLELVSQVLQQYQPIQVLVVSAIEEDDFVAQLRDLGVAYYLIKPFFIPELLDRIRYIDQYYHYGLSQFYIRDRRSIQQFLTNYFTKIGILPNYKGHRYLIDAILLVCQDSSWLDGITKRLYPAVAKGNRTTASHVERSIRYALDIAWTKGDIEQLEKLFPYAIDPAKGKPTNSAFIAKMADIINLRFSLR